MRRPGTSAEGTRRLTPSTSAPLGSLEIAPTQDASHFGSPSPLGATTQTLVSGIGYPKKLSLILYQDSKSLRGADKYYRYSPPEILEQTSRFDGQQTPTRHLNQVARRLTADGAVGPLLRHSQLETSTSSDICSCQS
mmetsp:Transcript_155/g.271  ORF Transcript_155/g.271 Transcript_155/m.271 type:complete len:137 (-) Transcript_155:785-1195(-)